jgi:hypothetical protein
LQNVAKLGLICGVRLRIVVAHEFAASVALVLHRAPMFTGKLRRRQVVIGKRTVAFYRIYLSIHCQYMIAISTNN